MADITLRLTDQDQQLLNSLIDGANKFYGAAAARGVAHILNLIDAAKEPDAVLDGRVKPDHVG